jgi:hypothetical protein
MVGTRNGYNSLIRKFHGKQDNERIHTKRNPSDFLFTIYFLFFTYFQDVITVKNTSGTATEIDYNDIHLKMTSHVIYNEIVV